MLMLLMLMLMVMRMIAVIMMLEPRAGSSAAIHNLWENMIHKSISSFLKILVPFHDVLASFTYLIYFGQRMKGMETVAPNIVR